MSCVLLAGVSLVTTLSLTRRLTSALTAEGFDKVALVRVFVVDLFAGLSQQSSPSSVNKREFVNGGRRRSTKEMTILR